MPGIRPEEKESGVRGGGGWGGGGGEELFFWERTSKFFHK